MKMNSSVTVIILVLLIMSSKYVQDRAWLNDLLRSIVVGRVLRLLGFKDLLECIVWCIQAVRLRLCNKESHGPMDEFPLRIQWSAEKPISIEGEDLDQYVARLFSKSGYVKWCEAKPRGSCCCGANGGKCCCDC